MSGSNGNTPLPLPWIVTLGFLTLAAVVAALLLRNLRVATSS